MATDAGPIRAAIDGAVITLQMTPPVDERPPFELEIAGRSFECFAHRYRRAAYRDLPG